MKKGAGTKEFVEVAGHRLRVGTDGLPIVPTGEPDDERGTETEKASPLTPSLSGTAPRPHVMVMRGECAGLALPLEKRDVVIGRGQNADVQLSDHGLSRRHARIARHTSSYSVEDLGPRNGTFVNGESVTTRALEPEPAPYAANEYDAVLLAALAIQQAGTSTDGAAIRDALYRVSSGRKAVGPTEFVDAVNAITKGIDIDYVGASGGCDLDDLGNVTADYIVWHVEKQGDGTYAFATAGRIRAKDLPPQFVHGP
jgi:hypothetical protein